MDEEQKPVEQSEQPETSQQPNPTEVTTDGSDEQVPTDNTGDVISPGSEPKQAKDFKPPKKKKNFKKLFLWVLIIVILLGGAGAAYWFYFKDKGSNTSTTNQPVNAPGPAPVAKKMYEPVNVSYAYKAKTSDPYVIYYRPAIGGKRVTVSTLGATDEISYSDVSGQNVAYIIDNKIYVSTDGGAKFNEIFKGTAGSQITSIKFSNDGDKLAFAYLEKTGGKNVVKSGDLEGKNFTDLFTSTKAGVFIVGWSSGKNKIVYREGCYGCDGPAGLPSIQDLKTKKATVLISSIKEDELVSVKVSDDMSKLVFVRSTENSAGPSTLGTFTGAPYVFNSVDLANNKVTEIATVGTKGEKNANGTYKTRNVTIGFLAGTNTPYYSADSMLYTVKGGTASLTYQASKDILYVPYVSDTIVIASSGTDTSDYTLDNYNINTKKTTNIFSGDNNTIIFGVTTK